MNLDKATNKLLTEDRLTGDLASKLDISPEQASAIMKSLDFETYVSLEVALQNNDIESARSLIELEETSNSYSAARQAGDLGNTQDPNAEPQMDVSALNTGQTIKTSQGDAKINDVQKMGAETNYSTDKDTNITVSDQPYIPKAPVTSKDDAEQEIARLQQMAGIDQGLGEEAHTNGPNTVSPSSCAAMAGVGTSVNQIKKRHKKPEKPGPKPKNAK